MQRLIDAYVLNAEFEEIIDFLENNVQSKKTISKEEVCECIKALRECVDEQPTAYDAEKVVEELEEMKQNFVSNAQMLSARQIEKAIEIVRKGGVE